MNLSSEVASTAFDGRLFHNLIADVGRRNADDSLVLKRVLSSSKDGHKVRHGGELNHYLVLRYDTR